MNQGQGTYTARRFHDPLDDLLDRPIAFNPVFKKITGSTVAALFLSQAWYWSKRTSDNDGWFYKSRAEWEEEIGLSRSEQETACKHLKNLGILEMDLRGIPATLYYKIDKPRIYELMGIQFAGMSQTEIGRISPSGLLDSNNPDGEILANINRTEITTEITTETAAEYNAHLFRGDFHDFPEHLWKVAECLRDVWMFTLPTKPRSKSKGQYAFYCQSMDSIKDACAEFGIDVLIKVHEDWKAKFRDEIAPYTVAQPTSLINVCAGKARELRETKLPTLTQPFQTPNSEPDTRKLVTPEMMAKYPRPHVANR